MAENRTGIYDVRPPPPGFKFITVAAKEKLRVQSVGDVDVFQGMTDKLTKLVDVSYVHNLVFCLYLIV